MFDFGRFLTDKFDNPKGLVSFLSAYGAPAPGVSAVEKWFQRGTIPSQWFPIIVYYLGLEENVTAILLPYIKVPA